MSVFPGFLVVLLLIGFALQDTPALAPEPEASLQKETLKKIKDLFKDDYVKKSPSDQQALARKLLLSGQETSDDPTAKFVLLKESRDLAAASGDFETALRAADEMGKSFAVDIAAGKLAVLAKFAPKEPDAARAGAKWFLAVVVDGVRTDNFEAAGSAAQKAEALARVGQDAALAAKAGELKSDVTSLKAEAARAKPLLEKPGPNDGETIGRYLCFVKGNWEHGLPHLLLAGAKPPLNTAVEKEIAKPTEAAAQAELADLWWDIAQKEKSPWRKERMVGRCRFWLDQAAPLATGLVKVRVQKRLDEIDSLQPGYVNLLKLVDPAKDALAGTWKMGSSSPDPENSSDWNSPISLPRNTIFEWSSPGSPAKTTSARS
jgi:hypothetical protein